MARAEMDRGNGQQRRFLAVLLALLPVLSYLGHQPQASPWASPAVAPAAAVPTPHSEDADHSHHCHFVPASCSDQPLPADSGQALAEKGPLPLPANRQQRAESYISAALAGAFIPPPDKPPIPPV